MFVNCYSDKTHLINFIGNKKTYLMDMTLGNIHSEVHKKPRKITVSLPAPILFKTKLTLVSTAADETR